MEGALVREKPRRCRPGAGSSALARLALARASLACALALARRSVGLLSTVVVSLCTSELHQSVCQSGQPSHLAGAVGAAAHVACALALGHATRTSVSSECTFKEKKSEGGMLTWLQVVQSWVLEQVQAILFAFFLRGGLSLFGLTRLDEETVAEVVGGREMLSFPPCWH